MRIELRDENRRRIGRVMVDPALRPTRVVVQSHRPSRFVWRRLFAPARGASNQPPPGDGPQEVFLNWDSALDDAGRLRRCVACGFADMFREKAFPQVTVLVVVLAFVGAIVGALGLATDLPVLLTMAGVLVLDIAILVFSKRRLVCYRCRSTYHDLPIARYHRAWDRTKADRYPAPGPPSPASQPVAPHPPAAPAAPTPNTAHEASGAASTVIPGRTLIKSKSYFS